MTGKRQSNFEMLRVFAMAAIVAMHYMLKGGIAVPMSENGGLVNHVAWLIEAFCIVAANCYVLISGYFLTKVNDAGDYRWKFRKLAHMFFQVLGYSLLIPIVCKMIGIGAVSEWSIYDWIIVICPLQMDHYWFATSYILLFILAPVLAPALNAISKRQLELTISLLLFYYCVCKSLSPIHLATDNYGYDLGWFICLFLIAGYVRRYGIPFFCNFFKNKRNCFRLYAVCAVLIFAISASAGFICRKTGALEYYMDMPYCYNYFLTLLGSFALFYAFKQMEEKEGVFRTLCVKIAPYTFGVYLLHENLAVRNLWPVWLGVERWRDSLLFIPMLLLAVAVVFTVGTVVDFIRQKLFKAIEVAVIDKAVNFAKRRIFKEGN